MEPIYDGIQGGLDVCPATEVGLKGATLGPICAAAFRSFSSYRPRIATWVPSPANAAAMARPIPLPPPVTTATR